MTAILGRLDEANQAVALREYLETAAK